MSAERPMSLAVYVGGIQYAADMTNEQMAAHFGIGTETYQRVLEGEVPSAPLQVAIQEGLGLGVDEFDVMIGVMRGIALREHVIRGVVTVMEARARDNRSLGMDEGHLLGVLLRAVGEGERKGTRKK